MSCDYLRASAEEDNRLGLQVSFHKTEKVVKLVLEINDHKVLR
jgi:hypothetical protein